MYFFKLIGSGFRVQRSVFKGSGEAPAAGRQLAGLIEKVGSATVPTGFGGHGGPPYFTKIASKFV